MRRIASLVALACGFAALQVAPARAGAGDPLPPDTILTIRGKGWGHGRGMGQWGAKGMADGGKTHREILNHYYSDIAHGKRSNPTIRVLVEASPDVIVTSGRAFTVKPSGAKSQDWIAAPAGSFWRITYDAGSDVYRYARSKTWNGGWDLVRKTARHAVFAPDGGLLELVRSSGSVRRYRGTITARYSSTDGMRAINALPVESYLRGVVPRESPSSWPADALEAQSVAARTYAYRYRDASRARGNTFDICATTSCQVYEGHSGRNSPGGSIDFFEAVSTNAAIAATSGEVLLYGGDPILAEFSSSTGGYTAPGSVPYQRAVPDPGDSVSPHHSWSTDIRVSAIESRWPAIGRLVRIDVTDRNGYGEWGGRVQRLELVGTSKTVAISGDAFRGAFAWPTGGGVRSSWFTVGVVRAQGVSVPKTTNVAEGATKTVVYRYRNAGTDPWFVGGELRLHTDAGSPFRNDSWLSATTVAAISRNVTRPKANLIRPDEVAEFRVVLDAGDVQAGSYKLPLRLATIDGPNLDRFDLSVTVLESWIDASTSLLQSTSFEKGFRGWSRTGFDRSDGLGDGRDGSRGVVVDGEGRRTVSQTIDLAGGTNRRFFLGRWARARDARVSAAVLLRYEDGGAKRVTLDPDQGSAWGYAERGFRSSPSRSLDSVTVTFTLDVEPGGSASLDAVRLVEDPVGNPSFEQGGLGVWYILEQPADGLRAKLAGWTASDGRTSLLLPGRAKPVTVEQRFAWEVPAYDRVILRLSERAYGLDKAAPPMAVTLTLEHPDGTETAQTLEFERADHPWRPVTMELRPAAPVTFARLRFHQAGQTGRMYLDGIRLLRSRTAEPSFESLEGWNTGGLGDDDGLSTGSARDGASGLRLSGPDRAFVSQNLPLGGTRKRELRIGFFHNLVGGNDGRAQVVVRFSHRDGSVSWTRIPFDAGSHPWRYTEAIARSPEAFDGVRLTVVADGIARRASVDQLVLTLA